MLFRSYNVTLVAYHCGETDTILQTIQIFQVGINENSPSLFSATLNSNGSINILGNLQDIQEIKIYSSDGKLINSSTDANNLFNLNNYPNGIYLLKIKTEGNIQTIKLNFNR